MRMWMVSPEIMCRKHLLGEHVETHMLLAALHKGTSLEGYKRNGLFEPISLQPRHEALAVEIERRGYKHSSPFGDMPLKMDWSGKVKDDALQDLLNRCSECKARYVEKYND